MGIAEIIGFAACWVVVATLMLWGVFTERKRGPMRMEPPAGAVQAPPLARLPRTSPTDWIVVEVAEGTTPEVADQARFLAAAWLASRGIDASTVPSADLRTEVISGGDGNGTTRVLLRAGALHASRRHR
jgi:hypothetical protein